MRMHSHIQLNKHFVLITGASKGIGKAFAEECGRNKLNTILVARSADLLQSLSSQLSQQFSTVNHIFVADLSQNADIERLILFIEKLNLKIGGIINNAGIPAWGKFHDLSLSHQEDLINLNVLAPIRLTHSLLVNMAENAPSFILNVCSTAAFHPLPMMGVYGGSKVFLGNWSLALRLELKSKKINVCAFYPGPTHSSLPGVDELVNRAGRLNMRASFVARRGLSSALAGSAYCIPGVMNKIHFVLSRIAPISISSRIAAWSLRKGK